MKIEGKNAIHILIKEFDEMKAIYDESDNDCGCKDLDYYFFEIYFTPFIFEQIRQGNEPALIRIFSFIERLLRFGDDDLKTLVCVSVIESLYYDEVCNMFKPTLFKYCGNQTLQCFMNCLVDDEKLEWNKWLRAA